MARARNIKPGFFKNEDLAELPPLSRILFAGLWCLADRAGRLEDRPKRIRAEIIPYDDGSVDDMLDELHRAGFILRYEVDGQRFLQVLNFTKHQNPHCREPESTIPPPDEHSACTMQASEEHRTGPADSLNLIPDSRENTFVASKLPTCPHQKIIALYSEALPTLPQPRIWEGAREKNLAARWKWVLSDLKSKCKPCDPEDGLDFFRRLFGYVAESDFLTGRAGDWSADLGWIVKAENFAKILQGNYENKREAA